MGGYKFLCLLFLAIITASCHGLPRINNENGPEANGLGSESVAASVLKARFNSQENVVFAPFGYTAILAMLGEGARGETQKEIRNFLNLPGDSKRTRDSFRTLMKLYSGEEPELVPQFKTWFYVYENNSVNQEFVDTLRDDYQVEIKTIQRNFYDFDEPSEVQVSEKTLAEEPPAKATSDLKSLPTEEAAFDPVDLEGKYLPMTGDIDEILKQKECSRFDEEVDDQQYVEVQSLRDEDKEAAAVLAAVASSQPEDNETVHPIEKVDELKKIVKIDDNADKLKQLEEEMGVLAVARKHPVTKKFQAASGRALNEVKDVSAALSGNSLMGRKAGDDAQAFESKMLLFNGLYFRGRWKTPFQRLRSDADAGNVFYLSDEQEPIEVAMMRSRGDFQTGFSEALQAKIIELPYESERYAMLVVMPVERDNGLRSLVGRLDYATIKQLSSDLKLRTVELSLPKFNVDTTSTVHKEFAEMGLTTLFSEAADLSGITTEQRLRVDELVQHVSVRVDEGSSTENSISASDGVSRTAKSEADVEEQQDEPEKEETASSADETFVVDRPFLFFVRDTIDDVTLVAGMINKPRGPELFAEFIISQDRSSSSSAAAGPTKVNP